MKVQQDVRSCAGFTLLETLVGLTLLAIALLSAAPLFVHAMQNNAVGADFSTAGAVAVEHLERFRGAGYLSLAAGGDLSSNATTGPGGR